MHFHRLAITALTATSLLPVAASAQSPNPQPVSGAFRGMLVCEKIPASPDILRVPFDLKVDGGNVQYARPIFNWNGQRVLGSELGNGTLGSDGKIHLAAAWSIRGVSYRTEYTGTLTATGGTLTGTQSWQGGRGSGSSRTCNAAVVPAPQG
jgi:hypothetical protein